MEFIVSARHAEYMLDLPDDKMVCVWDADEDDLDAVIQASTEEEEKAAHAALRTKFREKVGQDPQGDWDLSWEQIYRITAERGEVETALEGLIDQISAEPGGDDDVFNYWPSGVLLAFEVAFKLGGAWQGRVEKVARRVIRDKGFEDELLDAVGLEAEEGSFDADEMDENPDLAEDMARINELSAQLKDPNLTLDQAKAIAQEAVAQWSELIDRQSY